MYALHSGYSISCMRVGTCLPPSPAHRDGPCRSLPDTAGWDCDRQSGEGWGLGGTGVDWSYSNMMARFLWCKYLITHRTIAPSSDYPKRSLELDLLGLRFTRSFCGWNCALFCVNDYLLSNCLSRRNPIPIALRPISWTHLFVPWRRRPGW